MLSERKEWIDQARGYALMMVVAGHLGIPVFGKYITAFHIPLFFFLSGYTFSAKGNYKQFLFKKSKRLLVPYLFLGIPLICASLITRALSGTIITEDLPEVLKLFLLQRRYCTIWFLTCLFLVYQVFFLIDRLCDHNAKRIMIVGVLLGVIGLIYNTYCGAYLVWNADLILMAAPFFAAGYFCSLNSITFERVKQLSVLPFILIAAVYVLSVYINIKISGQVINFAINEYGNIFFSLISVVCGVVATIWISSKITIPIVGYLGKNTMIYFGWHQSIALPILLAFYNYVGLFQQDNLLSDGLRALVTFVAMFAILAPIEILVRKKSPKLVGL